MVNNERQAATNFAIRTLGDDIGQELVFDGCDLVLQRQLALLQTLYLQLIGMRRNLLRHDLDIEIAVFGSQSRQLLAKFALVGSLHRPLSVLP